MLHPSVRLLLWGVAVTCVQWLDGVRLLSAFTAVTLSTLVVAPRRFVRLLRRARWLLLSIALVFVFATPGELMFAALGSASPTFEGVWLAMSHVAKLVSLLALLALLLEFTPHDTMIAGLHGLFGPLAAVGFPRDRLALRLMLVLRYAEEFRLPGRNTWHNWLAAMEHDAPSTSVQIRKVRLSTPDIIALAGLGAVALWVALVQAN